MLLLQLTMYSLPRTDWAPRAVAIAWTSSNTSPGYSPSKTSLWTEPLDLCQSACYGDCNINRVGSSGGGAQDKPRAHNDRPPGWPTSAAGPASRLVPESTMALLVEALSSDHDPSPAGPSSALVNTLCQSAEGPNTEEPPASFTPSNCTLKSGEKLTF